MFCTKCGTRVLEGQEFCTSCGQKLDQEEAVPPGQIVPPPPAPQPPSGYAPPSPPPKGDSKIKIALVAAGAAVLVCAIVGVAVFLFILKDDPDSQVAAATTTTLVPSSSSTSTSLIGSVYKTPEQDARSVVEDFLNAIMSDQPNQAHALTIEPFSYDGASAAYSNGKFKSFVITQVQPVGDGTFWVLTTENWYGNQNYFKYLAVPTDAGWRIKDAGVQE